MNRGLSCPREQRHVDPSDTSHRSELARRRNLETGMVVGAEMSVYHSGMTELLSADTRSNDKTLTGAGACAIQETISPFGPPTLAEKAK